MHKKFKINFYVYFKFNVLTNVWGAKLLVPSIRLSKHVEFYNFPVYGNDKTQTEGEM